MIISSSWQFFPPIFYPHHVSNHSHQTFFALSIVQFNQQPHWSFFWSIVHFEMMDFPFFDRRKINILKIAINCQYKSNLYLIVLCKLFSLWTFDCFDCEGKAGGKFWIELLLNIYWSLNYPGYWSFWSFYFLFLERSRTSCFTNVCFNLSVALSILSSLFLDLFCLFNRYSCFTICYSS